MTSDTLVPPPPVDGTGLQDRRTRDAARSHLRLIRGGAEFVAEIDRAKRLAFLLRAQTDCLILADDPSIRKEERQKLRMAADILGEVHI